MLCCSQQWILDKQDLVRERQLDLQILSEEEYQKIGIFFSNCKLQLKLQTVKPLKSTNCCYASCTIIHKLFFFTNYLIEKYY